MLTTDRYGNVCTIEKVAIFLKAVGLVVPFGTIGAERVNKNCMGSVVF